MKSIKDNVTNTIIINKSKFITNLYYVKDINEIDKILDEIKKEYRSATHVCFAYILSNKEKCSDDNEPSGTAGMPILNVLKMNNLNNVLCVVIRYFGGIKLGAGGLVRAYSNSVLAALKTTSIVELEECYLIEIEFKYDNLKLIDYILSDKTIIDKVYNDNIIYRFYLNKKELDFIPQLEKSVIHLSIKEEKLIKN